MEQALIDMLVSSLFRSCDMFSRYIYSYHVAFMQKEA